LTSRANRESLGVNKTAELILSENAHITDMHNMAWSGTAIVSGRGKGIAVATGMDTYVGKIAKMLEGDDNAKTPLQQRLSKVSSVLGNAAWLSVPLFLSLRSSRACRSRESS
jgi:Ca2+-transporting ATPase